VLIRNNFSLAYIPLSDISLKIIGNESAKNYIKKRRTLLLFIKVDELHETRSTHRDMTN
jgi:hypothetical protein